MKPYVLLIGYRQALAKALHRLDIDYSVWTEQPLKSVPKGVDKVIVEPYPLVKTEKEQRLKNIDLLRQPTHVISGTEAAVFPAAVLRRWFGARRSPDTLLTRCTDKAAMKNYLRKYDIPMTGFVAHTPKLTAAELVDQLGLPVVVKEKRGWGGRNIVIARSEVEVAQNMNRNKLYEAFVDAPEGSIETIIDNGKILFCSVTDYYEKKFVNIVPARFNATETAQIMALNESVLKALRIRWGLTHLEYYRATNGILFGEIALRPPGGYIMKLIEQAYGFDPWQSLVEVELGLPSTALPDTAARVAGCMIFHPGAGVVSLADKPTVKDYPSLISCTLKAGVGDTIDPRKGVGEDLGYCILASPRHEQLIDDISALQAAPPVQTS